jgi:hypothetical protein
MGEWSTSRVSQLTTGKKRQNRLDYEAEWTSEPVRMLKFEVNLLPCRKSKNSNHPNLYF